VSLLARGASLDWVECSRSMCEEFLVRGPGWLAPSFLYVPSISLGRRVWLACVY
jgi:hypothetical protein